MKRPLYIKTASNSASNEPLFDQIGPDLVPQTAISIRSKICGRTVTGAVINFLSFTVLQFDGYGGILPLGFGPVVGNMVMMVCGYFGCSEFSVPSTYNRSYMHNETMIISGNKTQETVFFNHGLTCLYQDSAKLNQKYVMLIYILVGLPGWMLTCRHIYAKTPIRFLDYSSLFSCGVLFSSIRTWRCV